MTAPTVQQKCDGCKWYRKTLSGNARWIEHRCELHPKFVVCTGWLDSAPSGCPKREEVET